MIHLLREKKITKTNFLILLIVTAYLFSSNSFAQNPDLKRTNHWYFGLGAGLDFSSGSPVADTTGQMQVQQGTATISDTSGNLLFYSNGNTVWNAVHDTMMNGTGLGVANVSTPYQGIAIIPKPGNNSIYYIFTVDGYENQHGANGMRWHEVDMTLDNGKGAVTSKNNVLFAPGPEMIYATKHANGCDYWVTSHELGSANFRSYLVAANGVNTVPVISTTGLYYSPQQNPNTGAVGYFLLFSPDGTKVGAIVSYVYAITGLLQDSLELFDFNKNTGAFTNISNIPIDTSAAYFCFSPNSQFLYMEMGYWMHTLYQWDISSGIDSIINNSKTIIHNGILKGIAPAMQLGRDGKIYMGTATAQINPSDTLSVINYPNLLGTACGLQLKTIPLRRHIQNNFPNFVSNFLVNDTSFNCTTGLKEIDRSDYFEVCPNPATDFIRIKNNEKYSALNYTATLLDIAGRKIFSGRFKNNEEVISLIKYSNGMYILQISTENKLIFNKKIIIHH